MGSRTLNGTSDYLSATGINFGTGPFSVLCWFKKNGNGTYGGLVSKDDTNDTAGWSLNLGSDNTVNFFCATNGTNYDLATSAAVTDTNWHLAIGVRDGTHVILYLDGANVAQVTDHALQINNSQAIAFGLYRSQDTTHNLFKGSLAEAATHNVALSAANATSLWGGGTAGAPPLSIQTSHCDGHWQLLGSDSPEPDNSGSGNNATVSGTTQGATPPVSYKAAGAGTINAAVTEKASSVKAGAAGISGAATATVTHSIRAGAAGLAAAATEKASSVKAASAAVNAAAAEKASSVKSATGAVAGAAAEKASSVQAGVGHVAAGATVVAGGAPAPPAAKTGPQMVYLSDRTGYLPSVGERPVWEGEHLHAFSGRAVCRATGSVSGSRAAGLAPVKVGVPRQVQLRHWEFNLRSRSQVRSFVTGSHRDRLRELIAQDERDVRDGVYA